MNEFWETVCETISWILVFGALLLTLPSCAGWNATQISTGATAGRTFEDGAVFSSGKTIWQINTNVVWTPTKKGN